MIKFTFQVSFPFQILIWWIIIYYKKFCIKLKSVPSVLLSVIFLPLRTHGHSTLVSSRRKHESVREQVRECQKESKREAKEKKAYSASSSSSERRSLKPGPDYWLRRGTPPSKQHCLLPTDTLTVSSPCTRGLLTWANMSKAASHFRKPSLKGLNDIERSFKQQFRKHSLLSKKTFNFLVIYT